MLWSDLCTFYRLEVTPWAGHPEIGSTIWWFTCTTTLLTKIALINVMPNLWSAYLLFYVAASKRTACLSKITADSSWGAKVRVNHYSRKTIVHCFWHWSFVKILEDSSKTVRKLGSWKLLWLLFCQDDVKKKSGSLITSSLKGAYENKQPCLEFYSMKQNC